MIKIIVVHIKLLKPALNHVLILKKVHRVISFNQEAWMKNYVINNIEDRKKADSDFKKDFYKLMCNAVFGQSIEQVKNHRGIRLVTTDKERYQLVSEPNYHTTKRFSEDLIAVEMKKTELKMNKSIYLDIAILDISRTLMYEFWYNYLKPKHDNNIGLCYIDMIVLFFMLKQKIFIKMFLTMLILGLIHLHPQ